MDIGIIDLQLFAGEKTERATLKKRRDAREKGQVFRSVEINSAIILLTAFGMLRISLPKVWDNLQRIYIEFLGG